jgi:hypothetical protein
MSYQEKKAITSLIGTILSSMFYVNDVYQRYQAANLEPSQIFGFGAAAVLLYVPVQVVFQIILQALFIMVNIMATKKEEPEIVDELDKLVDLKSTRNFYHVFILGFFLSVATQVIPMQPIAMFVGFLLSMIVAGMSMDLSQLYFYRRGV